MSGDRYPGDEARTAVAPAKRTRRRHLCGCLTVWDNETERSVALHRCAVHRPPPGDPS